MALADEIEAILNKRFDRSRTGAYSAAIKAATADILDAVARDEAAVAENVRHPSFSTGRFAK